MSRVYKDNASNRNIGRVGKPIGSHVVSRGGVVTLASNELDRGNGSSYSSFGDLGRNNCVPTLRDSVSKSPSFSAGSLGRSNCYVDNDQNRTLGRVGLPLGSCVHHRVPPPSSAPSSLTIPAKATPRYFDSPVNSHLGMGDTVTAPVAHRRKYRTLLQPVPPPFLRNRTFDPVNSHLGMGDAATAPLAHRLKYRTPFQHVPPPFLRNRTFDPDMTSMNVTNATNIRVDYSFVSQPPSARLSNRSTSSISRLRLPEVMGDKVALPRTLPALANVEIYPSLTKIATEDEDFDIEMENGKIERNKDINKTVEELETEKTKLLATIEYLHLKHKEDLAKIQCKNEQDDGITCCEGLLILSALLTVMLIPIIFYYFLQ